MLVYTTFKFSWTDKRK